MTTNKDWMHTVQTNIGEVTIIAPPKRKSALRRPYEYLVSIAQWRELDREVKTILNAWKPLLQCALCDGKPTAYGRRFEIFLLGYRQNFTGEGGGMDAKDWQDCTRLIAAQLKRILGENISMYVEPWSGSSKFQARFETYIMFEELKP